MTQSRPNEISTMANRSGAKKRSNSNPATSIIPGTYILPEQKGA